MDPLTKIFFFIKVKTIQVIFEMEGGFMFKKFIIITNISFNFSMLHLVEIIER